ncbi:TPA: hypothetical protein ENS27_15550 [bacterium]|nr:hypothetical protein [bacterium]
MNIVEFLKEIGISGLLDITFISLLIYAFLVFSGIPYIEYQWGETQNMIFYVLMFEAVGIFVVSIFLPNIMLNSNKLSEKYRSVGDHVVGLRSLMAYIRLWSIILAAIGEACAINGLVLYLISGDQTRPWIFFLITIAHYTVVMGKLRRVREDVEQLLKIN